MQTVTRIMALSLSTLMASLLLGAPVLAVEPERAPIATVAFLLGGDQWQPGNRYRSSRNWLALACDPAGCRLDPARLTVQREAWQGHYDDQPTQGQKLMFLRQAPAAANSTVLAWFKQNPAVPWLRAGPVTTYWATTMPPKRPVSEGTLELAVDLPGGGQTKLVPLLDAENNRFQLQLRAQGKRQLLGKLGRCSRMVSTSYLVWAGDIDRDGRPDYLIDLADEVGEASLYLAHNASVGEIVGVAAVYVPPPFGGKCDGQGWLMP